MASILLVIRANPGRGLMVEISNYFPYYTAKLTPEPEEQASGGQSASRPTEADAPEQAAAEDRLELVRAQNMASPTPETVDLAGAADLLRQVQDQLNLLEKQEAQELYQFDRLRDLLYQVSQNGGV
jgi:hypothetical protein